MKILIVDIGDYHKFPLGGIVYFIKNILECYKYENEITLCGSGVSEDFIYINNNRYKYINICNLNRKKIKWIPNRIYFFIFLILNISKIKLNKYDLIWVHSPELLIPFLIKRNNRIKVVWHLHGLLRETSSNSNYKFIRSRIFTNIFYLIQKHLLRLIDLIIPVSYEGEKLVKKLYPYINVKYLPTTYNPSIFYKRNKKYYRDKYQIDYKSKVIIFSGRLAPLKNIELLLDVFKILYATDKSFLLLIAGDGPLRKVLENKAKRTQNILFLGVVDHDEKLPELLSLSDLFVFTSVKGEGMPLAVLEAVACDVPVISTEVGDVSKLLQNGKCGYTINDFEAINFANKILYYWKILNTINPINHISDIYNANYYSEKIRDIFFDLVDK